MSVFIALSFAILIFVLLYITMGGAGIVIGFLLLFLAGIIAFMLFLTRSIIHLNEMEVGVIFNKRSDNFAYFIDADVKDSDKYKFINILCIGVLFFFINKLKVTTFGEFIAYSGFATNILILVNFLEYSIKE